MRVSIDKGFDPLIKKVMANIQTTEPRLAVQHIIGLWAESQQQLVNSDGNVDAAKLEEVLDDIELDLDSVQQHG
ncbi:hypothetical protein U2F10_24205 [Leptothoe sp. EHU-05/26/07-4]